jgi:hypothetical protein
LPLPFETEEQKKKVFQRKKAKELETERQIHIFKKKLMPEKLLCIIQTTQSTCFESAAIMEWRRPEFERFPADSAWRDD